MTRYVMRSKDVEVWRRGEPLPEGWPEWAIGADPRYPEPLWAVKMSHGGYGCYYTDEAFYRDFEAAA